MSTSKIVVSCVTFIGVEGGLAKVRISDEDGTRDLIVTPYTTFQLERRAVETSAQSSNTAVSEGVPVTSEVTSGRGPHTAGSSPASRANETDGCRYPMSYGAKCAIYPNCPCGTPDKTPAETITGHVPPCKHDGRVSKNGWIWCRECGGLMGIQPDKTEPAREYEHTCCKCGKKFTAPSPPTGVSFCGYGCT